MTISEFTRLVNRLKPVHPKDPRFAMIEAERRGAGDAFFAFCAAGPYKVEKHGTTPNGHIVLEFWAEGHMVGFRTSWAALERLARQYDAADPDGRLTILERENRREYPAIMEAR